MYISCFSDELCVDLPDALPILKDWGLDSFIRVTVGREKENKRFIKELKRLL